MLLFVSSCMFEGAMLEVLIYDPIYALLLECVAGYNLKISRLEFTFTIGNVRLINV